MKRVFVVDRFPQRETTLGVCLQHRDPRVAGYGVADYLYDEFGAELSRPDLPRLNAIEADSRIRSIVVLPEQRIEEYASEHGFSPVLARHGVVLHEGFHAVVADLGLQVALSNLSLEVAHTATWKEWTRMAIQHGAVPVDGRGNASGFVLANELVAHSISVMMEDEDPASRGTAWAARPKAQLLRPLNEWAKMAAEMVESYSVTDGSQTRRWTLFLEAFTNAVKVL